MQRRSPSPAATRASRSKASACRWSGYFAPLNTPPAVVAKLEAGFRKAITDPDVSSKLKVMAVTHPDMPDLPGFVA